MKMGPRTLGSKLSEINVCNRGTSGSLSSSSVNSFWHRIVIRIFIKLSTHNVNYVERFPIGDGWMLSLLHVMKKTKTNEIDRCRRIFFIFFQILDQRL